jgi:hypothetical protein
MAIDPDSLRSYIDRRGSRLFHVTPVENIPAIREHGLIPGGERGSTTRDDFFAPRPGHVYMVKLLDVPVIEVNGEPRVVAIDLEQLDPAGIDPDEDIVQQHLALMVDVNPPTRDMEGDSEAPGQVGGLATWAETTPGFDRPDVTVRSLEEHGRISYRGAIPVNAIEVLELPSEHVSAFAQRVHDILGGDPPQVPHAGMWKTEVERAKALGATCAAAAAKQLGLDNLVVDLSDYVPAQDAEEALRRVGLEALRADPPRFPDGDLARSAAAVAETAVRFDPTDSVRANLDYALALAEQAANTVVCLAKVAGADAAEAVARGALAAAGGVPWDAHLVR